MCFPSFCSKLLKFSDILDTLRIVSGKTGYGLGVNLINQTLSAIPQQLLKSRSFCSKSPGYSFIAIYANQDVLFIFFKQCLVISLLGFVGLILFFFKSGNPAIDCYSFSFR